MANKWTRRGRGKRPNRQRLCNMRLDFRTGDVTLTMGEASLETHKRYFQAHSHLPKDIESWSEGRLRQVLEVATITGKEADWERSLVLLAHHRSELACDLLREVEHRVPRAVGTFWELAYGESLNCLGYDYIPDEEGRPMAASTAGRRN